MQKASFCTDFTHTRCLLSPGLPEHCKGKARPYTKKITSPIPKTQLLLGRKLLNSTSNTRGSSAGRGKTPIKGYFSDSMPLCMQDMVEGSLSIKRKRIREAETPILLWRGAEEPRRTSTGCVWALSPLTASSRSSSAPTAPAKEQGQPLPPCRASKGCSTICWTSWWSQQSRRLSLPFLPSGFSSSPLILPFSKTFSPCLPSLPPCPLAPHSAFWDTQTT